MPFSSLNTHTSAATNWNTAIRQSTVNPPKVSENVSNANLHAAITAGNIDLFRELLAQATAAEVVARTNGETPLMAAVQEEDIEFISELLDSRHDLDVNATWRKTGDIERDGKTVLMYAINHLPADIALALIKHKDINLNSLCADRKTALMYASIKGDRALQTTKILLADPTIQINITDGDGYTALRHAIDNGHVATTKEMIYHKDTDVNAKGPQGFTDLMAAVIARGNRAALVEALFQRKELNVNATTKQGFTALMIAAALGDVETVKTLLRHKDIKADARSKQGVTAMSMAIAMEHVELIDMLKHTMHPLQAQNDLLMVGGGVPYILDLLFEKNVPRKGLSAEIEKALRNAAKEQNLESDGQLIDAITVESDTETGQTRQKMETVEFNEWVIGKIIDHTISTWTQNKGQENADRPRTGADAAQVPVRPRRMG